MSIAYKAIALLRKLQNTIPKSSPLTTFEFSKHRDLDYGNIVYHQPNNASFCQKPEFIQHQTAQAITVAIHWTTQ